MDPLKLRLMAVHEAGHAIVALKIGKDVSELRIDASGGYCISHFPQPKRAWHAASSLAGVYACRMFCRDNPFLDEFNSWENCHEDLRLFYEHRGGMTRRYARRLAIAILSDFEKDVMA